MTTEFGVLCINGAGLNSAIWSELMPLLEIPALAIEYPNRGREEKANKELSFDAYVESAMIQATRWDRRRIIIIAHSIGGTVALALKEHLRDRLAAFVALSAILPKNGSNVVSCLPFPKNLLMPVVMSLLGTKPPLKTIAHDLCNDLNADQTNTIINGFTPESKQLYTGRVNYKKMDCPTLYITFTKDLAVPITVQQKMVENISAGQTTSIDAGHLAMMSKPKEVAAVINEFLKQVKLIR